MAKHLTDVWQTSDGQIFGSEMEALDHEERVLAFKQTSELAKDIINVMQRDSYAFSPGPYTKTEVRLYLTGSDLGKLLEQRGFKYVG